MSKRVKVEGRIITVPDDATPDEIDAIAGGGAPKNALQERIDTLRAGIAQSSPEAVYQRQVNKMGFDPMSSYHAATAYGADQALRGIADVPGQIVGGVKSMVTPTPMSADAPLGERVKTALADTPLVKIPVTAAKTVAGIPGMVRDIVSKPDLEVPRMLGQGAGNALIPVAAKGLGRVAQMIPSKSVAGQQFQQVMGAARDVPVDLTGPLDEVANAYKLSTRGFNRPKVITDFVKRLDDPFAGPMTYEEARDFAQAAGRLSAADKAAMAPRMRMAISRLGKSLDEANRMAAQSVGEGETYDSAMKGYARASTLDEAKELLKQEMLKKALGGFGTVAGGTSAYYMGKKLGMIP